MRLVKTAAALAEYDKRKAALDAEFKSIQNGTGIGGHERMLAIIQETTCLITPVREAFYQDTKDRNCHDNAMLVPLQTLREWVDKEKKQLDNAT